MPLQPIVTSNGPLDFAVSSGFAYRFSRYLVLPHITASDEFKSGQPFHLLPMMRTITDGFLTAEEQQAIYVRNNGKPESVWDAIRWYVPYLGRKSACIERVRPGWYCMPTGDPRAETNDDQIEEEIAEEAGEPGAPTDGWIYAFTFPELIKEGTYPIKVGMTIRDVDERVGDQCRGSAIFSPPKILKSWPVQKVSLTERTLQNLLKLSGQWKSEAPGTEWFITSPEEVERLLGIVQKETR
jgi:hypothetical protein